MPSSAEHPRVIVALDFPDPGRALEFVGQLDPRHCRVKVGKELFTRGGPMMVERLVSTGYDVFLDLKFHDIPNTVARACVAAAELGVWMLNVHALGGRKMMEGAREALEALPGKRPLLIAVTVLTSLGDEDIHEVGMAGTAADNVLRLARVARRAGADGVVCSPREVKALRQTQGRDFCLVTPGIRPRGAATGDQKRIMSPGEAVAAGSDYLVVGRPITEAPDPLAALQAIQGEIDTQIAATQ
ncbi:orotidine-5'-phosphate decarboxylase [Ectothiorhodospiraceae bacterium 2226]|nr:orotidine-5'-phosphate decarboxylase [Ectothiorhodospiraceae bacterium 2226]